MYTIEERERLRETLVVTARADQRISGAAITGSAALGADDRWSDLDLAFGIADPARLRDVLTDWTNVMYRENEQLQPNNGTSPRGGLQRRLALFARGSSAIC